MYSGHVDRGEQNLFTAHCKRLELLEEMVEQVALGGGERRVQVVGDEVLARSVAQTPRKGVGVPLRARRIRQRTGVLVDPQREDRGLERRGQELTLGEDPDQRGRQGAVVRQHRRFRVDPVRELGLAVMIEEDLVHRRVERDPLELAEARRVRGLDHDQAADRVGLEARDLDHGVELVGVQAVEVADVAVERPDGHHGAGIEATRGEHRRERVEVGVPVGGDDLLGAHGFILPRPPGRGRSASSTPCNRLLLGVFRALAQACAIASISTRAPLGSCEMPIVERAGGRSPT